MSSIRINQVELIELTDKQNKSSQVKWFKEKLGVDVVCDSKGPIMTHEIYNDLLKKRYGLLDLQNKEASKRPQVALRQS
jgi:hypothetical protein